MTQPTQAVFQLSADELGGLLEWHKSREVPDKKSIREIKRAIEDIRMAEVYNARFHAKDCVLLKEENQEEGIIS